MNRDRKSDLRITCIDLLVAAATIVLAGCTDTAQGQPDQVIQTAGPQNDRPAVPATTAFMTTAATQKPVQTGTSPAPATGAIRFDPPGSHKAGDTFDITGTTSLPAGTNRFWDIVPDPGKVPTGIDMSAQLGIMANNQVTKGNAGSNRVSLTADTKDLPAGKYVIVAVSLKGDPATVDPSTGTLAGYTYVTLT